MANLVQRNRRMVFSSRFHKEYSYVSEAVSSYFWISLAFKSFEQKGREGVPEKKTPQCYYYACETESQQL